MPKRRTRKQRQPFREEEAFLKMCAEAFVMPIFRLSATFILNRPIKIYRFRRNLVIDVIGLAILIAILVFLGRLSLFGHRFVIFDQIVIGITGLLLLSLMIGQLRKRLGHKYTASDMSQTLESVLRTMDATAKWYNDEDEANVELVTCLKVLKIDAEYGYELPNGRIADARVGSGLVEGKLSPITSEVDRLLGQLPDLTPYGDKVHVVIYGRLSGDARKRIENEISTRYLGKVFLVALSDPKRLRVENI